MKQIEENSYITDDGMIWLVVDDEESAHRILDLNMFELFLVYEDSSESQIMTIEDLTSHYRREDNTLVCIPVGKLEKTEDLLYKI